MQLARPARRVLLLVLLHLHHATGFDDPRAHIAVHHDPIEVWPLLPTGAGGRSTVESDAHARRHWQGDSIHSMPPQQRSSSAAARAAALAASDDDSTKERLLMMPVYGVFAICIIALLLALCGGDPDAKSGGARDGESEELMLSPHGSVEPAAAVAVDSGPACLQRSGSRRACNPVHL